MPLTRADSLDPLSAAMACRRLAETERFTPSRIVRSSRLAPRETALAEMTLHYARTDELDVEGVLAFAEHLLLNVARMWADASLDQKQRLQRVVFPRGVTYGDAVFGTAELSLVFTMLQGIAAHENGEASAMGFPRHSASRFCSWGR